MISKEILDLIEQFITYHRIDKGHSEETIKAYRYELIYLFNIINLHIKEIKKIKDLTLSDIRKLTQFLTDVKENSKITIARKISVLNSFYRYIERYISTDENPIPNIMKKIDSPKIPKKILERPTQNQIKQLFNHIENRKYRNDFERKTILLYFYLKFSSMARRIEMIRIKIKDIDFENNRIKLIGKGNKERIVPIDEDIIKLIKEYIEFANLKGEDLLIRNKNNQPITKRALNKRVSTIVSEANLPDWITTHMIRKGSASISWELGADIVSLQDNLGHSDPKTTRLYVIPEKEIVENDLRKSSPINIIKKEK